MARSIAKVPNVLPAGLLCRLTIFAAKAKLAVWARSLWRLLQGMIACGECGHKMVIQYKHGPRYLCNYLRQQYRVPVCQYIPADAVDAQVVEAFFQVLSPLELDVYEQAVAAQQAEEEQVAHAHQQHLERLRYEAGLARASVPSG